MKRLESFISRYFIRTSLILAIAVFFVLVIADWFSEGSKIRLYMKLTTDMEKMQRGGLITGVINARTFQIDPELQRAVLLMKESPVAALKIYERRIAEGTADAGTYYWAAHILEYGDTTSSQRDTNIARAQQLLLEGAGRFPDAAYLVMRAARSDETGVRMLEHLRGTDLVEPDRLERSINRRRTAMELRRRVAASRDMDTTAYLLRRDRAARMLELTQMLSKLRAQARNLMAGDNRRRLLDAQIREYRAEFEELASEARREIDTSSIAVRFHID